MANETAGRLGLGRMGHAMVACLLKAADAGLTLWPEDVLVSDSLESP